MTSLRLCGSLLLCGLAFAQDIRPEGLASKCDSEIPWITDGVNLPDCESLGRRAPKPKTERADLLEEAKAKAAEQKRLILWHVPRVHGGHMNRATIVDGYMRSCVFTDEAVVDLIQRKFVPLRMTADGKIGPEMDIVPFDFVEPGFVFLKPDGEVVHKIDRIRTFSADWVLHALRAVLAKHAEFNAPAGGTAEEMVRGGDLEKAVERDEPYWRGVALRRLRRGDEALKALDAAKQPEAAVERAFTLLCMGRAEDARKSFEAALQKPSARTAESHFWLAHLDWHSSREKEAEERWRKLVSDYPKTRWAWRAAANLVKGKDTLLDGAALHSFEDAVWAPAAAYAELPDRTRWARDAASVDDVARRAVEFLLRHQRSNGGWTDSRYVYCNSPKILPNVFVAAASLGAAALHEWRHLDPKRIEAAIARAEKYALDDANMNRGQNEECYADAYRLLYLSRKIAGRKNEATVKRMNEIVGALAKQQKRMGSWAHEYPNPFCTAAVVECLHLAKSAGATVDDAVLAKAADGMLKTRGPNGRQAYGAGGPPSSAKNSMARSAMCEHALYLCGKATKPDIEAALGDYWKHLKRLEAVRVCDFHSDEELGGFFFFHGVLHASQAAMALDEAKRKEHQAKFLDQMLAIPEIDGSFIDSHELGKCYGTAMALLVLRNALPKKE